MQSVDSVYASIYPYLQPQNFPTIVSVPDGQSFPEFVTQHLEKYNSFYRSNLEVFVKEGNFDTDEIGIQIDSICTALSDTIKHYYNGETFRAHKTFNEAMDKFISYNNNEGEPFTKLYIIPEKDFYRSRMDLKERFGRKDMFHIPFEKRFYASTNRYSIPGFPALYVGDSSYVCWEEAEQPKLRDMWFTRIQNQTNLLVLNIERFEDFFKGLQKVEELRRQSNFGATPLKQVLSYLVRYPLSFCCTIKVKHSKGSFKPEYIISQMLMEYVSAPEKEIDGIKYPSSKVDYNKLYNVFAYNYVFPVKQVCNVGYCPTLMKKFKLTDATSLELEEIINNPAIPGNIFGFEEEELQSQLIEIVTGQQTPYLNTGFGKMEYILKKRNLLEVL